MPERREDYPSDAAYTNFRAVALGSIPAGRLYRSSSPIDPNQGQRRFVADTLLKGTGVVTVVNTSDCRFRFKGFEGFDATHYATLNHIALNMGHDYPSDAFLEDVRNGLDFMGSFEGPYLIHGTQGVERTGYVCMVLEALMGASREEILADYLRSYADYYQVERSSDNWQLLEKEAVQNLLTFTGAADETALTQLDLAQATEQYLLQTVGLSQKQVDALKANLSKQ